MGENAVPRRSAVSASWEDCVSEHEASHTCGDSADLRIRREPMGKDECTQGECPVLLLMGTSPTFRNSDHR